MHPKLNGFNLAVCALNENSGLFYNSFVYFLDHPQYCSLRSILQCQSSKMSILFLSCLSIFYFIKVFKEKHCLHNSEFCMYEQVSASEYFFKAFIAFLLSTSMWDVFWLLFPVLLTVNTKTLKLSTISISSLSVLKLIAVPVFINLVLFIFNHSTIFFLYSLTFITTASSSFVFSVVRVISVICFITW